MINEAKRMIHDADKFPLAMRIAAKLYLGGVGEPEFRSMKLDTGANPLPQPLVLQVGNHLRDLELGFTIMTGELERCARSL